MLALLDNSGVFEGDPNCLVFTHSVQVMTANMYRTAGRLLAMCLTQGGPGVHRIAEAVYRYWTGLPVPDDLLSVNLVADCEMRNHIQLVWYSFNSF